MTFVCAMKLVDIIKMTVQTRPMIQLLKCVLILHRVIFSSCLFEKYKDHRVSGLLLCVKRLSFNLGAKISIREIIIIYSIQCLYHHFTISFGLKSYTLIVKRSLLQYDSILEIHFVAGETLSLNDIVMKLFHHPYLQ